MKHRRLFAAFTAAALVLSLTGCSGDDEELSFGTEESSRAETSGSQSGDDEEYDNSGRTFGDSATQLSQRDAAFNEQRRSPDQPPHAFGQYGNGRQRLDDFRVPLRL